MLHKRILIVLLINLAFIIKSGDCNASFNNNHVYNIDDANAWLNLGFGYGSSGFASGLSYSSLRENGIISSRLTYSVELDIESPWIHVWDAGFLYGVTAATPNIRAVISAGIGLTGGARQGEMTASYLMLGRSFERLTFYTVGLPVEAQLFWDISSSINIGIYGFANLNSQKSFFGGMICLHFMDKIR